MSKTRSPFVTFLHSDHFTKTLSLLLTEPATSTRSMVSDGPEPWVMEVAPAGVWRVVRVYAPDDAGKVGPCIGELFYIIRDSVRDLNETEILVSDLGWTHRQFVIRCGPRWPHDQSNYREVLPDSLNYIVRVRSNDFAAMASSVIGLLHDVFMDVDRTGSYKDWHAVDDRVAELKEANLEFVEHAKS